MAVKLVTGNTGAAVAPAEDGNLYKGIIGDGLIRLRGESEESIYLKEQDAKKLLTLHEGTYIYLGRQIEIVGGETFLFGDSDITAGDMFGFWYSRSDTGVESLEKGQTQDKTYILEDINLQTQGFIPFCTIGKDKDGISNIETVWAKEVRTLNELSNPFIYDDHQRGGKIEVGSNTLISVPPEQTIKHGRYLSVLSLQLAAAPTPEPISVKIRFEDNTDYDYVADSREAAMQIVGIHEFLPDAKNLTARGYIWNPAENQEIEIVDLKFQLFQLN